MRYFVNDSCIGCGLCTDTCPEVFSMSGDGCAVAKTEEVPAEYLERAAQAYNECPVGAIEEQ